jgi:hypothetical protein
LIDQDWELMTDTCAHLALGWPAGEVGRHAARRLRERVTPEAARAIPPYDIETCLVDLERIRNYYEIDRWTIGGNSWDADLALIYDPMRPLR